MGDKTSLAIFISVTLPLLALYLVGTIGGAIRGRILARRFDADRKIMLMQIETQQKLKRDAEPERTFAGIGDDGEMIFVQEEHGSTSQQSTKTDAT